MMEEQIPDTQPGLQVDHESRTYFKDAARWSNFISVIYLICFGLFALVLLLAGPYLFSNQVPSQYDGIQVEQDNPMMRALQLVTMVVFLIYAGIMLLRFAAACRRGVETQDQPSFNFGLRALRNYFVAMAIYTIFRVLMDIVTLST